MSSSQKVRTPLGRFSYPSLVKPSKPEGSDGDPNYNVTQIFSSDADLTAIRQGIKAAALEKWSEEKLASMIKANKFRSPLKSNALMTDDEGNPRQGYEDQDGFHLTAKSYENDKYIIVDKDRVEIEASKVVAGYYGKLIVNFSAYDRAGNQGVTVWLSGIQVCKKGETFGSATPSEANDFDVEEGDALAEAAGSGSVDSSLF